MSLNSALEMMETYPPSIAATKKLKGTLPDGFVWYAFEWLGDSPGDWTVMKVTGAPTRTLKTGKNKGKPVLVQGEGKRTVYITDKEIQKASEDNKE